MAKFVDSNGLLYFWQKIKNQFAQKSEVPGASSTSPQMDGTAAVGTETTWAHGDHVHPTDTSRAPIASPTFTGTPKAPTAAAGTNTTQIATTAFVKNAVDSIDSGVVSVAGKTGAVTLTKSDISDLATVTTTANDTGLMTAADKTKLNGIATGAEVNQNAFSNVKVGSTTVAADAKTDTLEFAGSNVTLTPDATNDKVTIGITASNVTTALGNTAVNRAIADASGNNIADVYAKKTDIAGMYKYKGSVAIASALPENPTTGDVYNIEATSTYGAAGANVAWNGTSWDSLGEIFTIESITNAEIDTIVAS